MVEPDTTHRDVYLDIRNEMDLGSFVHGVFFLLGIIIFLPYLARGSSVIPDNTHGI
jgi:hypothetical protein